MTDRRSWTPGRLLAWAVALSVIGVWGYVMYLSVFVGRAEPRERLADETYRTEAEEICAPHRDRIDSLPFASELRSADERADQLDLATDELRVMITRLEQVELPDAPDEATAVGRWLVDWNTYLDDRDEYAERFRQGLDEPFRVTDRGGEQIDEKIDEFARINFMESCETPDDVG